ncbi:MAG: hypothetical protein CFH06_01015 [Alphaproteobacteria bacterium MarineAlpha3_Bin5]|nr:hypothetical protein [Magnetovibrio sp.]PPR77958.1 MAG: hypothetical protein CFH06_01015 [Alphaproteobacteria bacterium MarineAlpha3_Bin5]
MTEESDELTLNTQIANQFINIANSLISDGKPAMAIASGLRHASANFSAFAIASSQLTPPPLDTLNSEFNELFTYYFERHRENTPNDLGLEALIEKAKNEI